MVTTVYLDQILKRSVQEDFTVFQEMTIKLLLDQQVHIMMLKENSHLPIAKLVELDTCVTKTEFLTKKTSCVH